MVLDITAPPFHRLGSEVSQMGQRVRVAKSADLGEGKMVAVEVESQAIALARSGGEIFAFEDKCTHEDCELSTGTIYDNEVECSCHGGVFDMQTGSVVEEPPVEPIKVFAVAEEDGWIIIET